MKLTGHKTEAVYRRYAIVSEADLAAGVTRLAVLHESLTKGTRTVVPMRPVRSGGGHPGHRGCGPPRAAAPRSGPRARRAPPQHLRAGAPRSRGRCDHSRHLSRRGGAGVGTTLPHGPAGLRPPGGARPATFFRAARRRARRPSAGEGHHPLIAIEEMPRASSPEEIRTKLEAGRTAIASRLHALVVFRHRGHPLLTVLDLEALLVPLREVSVPHEVIAGQVEEGLSEEIEDRIGR